MLSEERIPNKIANAVNNVSHPYFQFFRPWFAVLVQLVTDKIKPHATERAAW
jgi:hypothetical protein